MARSLNELKKQYNSISHGQSLRGGGPGNRHGHKAKGKPKNMGKTISRLLSYVGKYKFRLILVFLCMIITTLFSLCAGHLIVPIINRITLAINPNAELNPSPIADFADGIIEKLVSTEFIKAITVNTAAEISVYIVAALIILGSVYFISALGSYLQARLMLSISQGSIQSIRNDLFKKLQALPVKYFDSHPTGEIMSRFTNDVDNIDVMLNNSLTSIVSGVVSLVGTFIFMITTNIWLTLITIIFVPLLIYAAGIIGKNSSKYFGEQQAALGAVNGYIEETISGQKVIKVFCHEEKSQEDFDKINNELYEDSRKAHSYANLLGPINMNIGNIL
jgi:ATP-binding cassette subfamily B protein